MKKYFIFAAAAVVAMAACSKVEDNFDLTSPSNKIAFVVADYSQQTKAPTSLATGEDAIFSFKTTATQFPEIGTPVIFMDEETIKAWDNSAEEVNATNIDSKDIYSWAPAIDYFWPKTGYINFYSYAGTKAPSVAVVASESPAENAGEKRKVTYTYNNVEIADNDNILVADAALHFNSNTDTYKKDHVSAGVPTLFRHQLGKIIFKVHLKTTKPASNNTTWKVRTINSETVNSVALASTLTIVKKGSLSLENVDELAANATKNTTTQAWSAVIANNAANVDGWIAADHATAANNEVIALETQTLTIETGTQESEEASPAYLIAERTIMPQITDNTKFVLYYEVSASHDNFTTDPFLKEIRSVGVDVAKSMKDLVSSIPDWNKNTKVTYTINIDPVSEKVTFDPAVEEWASETGAFDVPLN